MGWRGGCLAALCYYCLGSLQYPGCVFEALAVGLGGQVRCRFSLFPLGSFLSSPPLRCARRVVPSRCPFPSPAGTPFNVVCEFRGLGLVALLVRAACPLGVGVLVLPRRTHLSPPPGRCGARTTRGPGAWRC